MQICYRKKKTQYLLRSIEQNSNTKWNCGSCRARRRIFDRSNSIRVPGCRIDPGAGLYLIGRNETNVQPRRSCQHRSVSAFFNASSVIFYCRPCCLLSAPLDAPRRFDIDPRARSDFATLRKTSRSEEEGEGGRRWGKKSSTERGSKYGSVFPQREREREIFILVKFHLSELDTFDWHTCGWLQTSTCFSLLFFSSLLCALFLILCFLSAIFTLRSRKTYAEWRHFRVTFLGNPRKRLTWDIDRVLHYMSRVIATRFRQNRFESASKYISIPERGR